MSALQEETAAAKMPKEKRATVRVFVIDKELNVLGSSAPVVGDAQSGMQSMPRGLHETLRRLIAQCETDRAAMHALVFMQTRIVRLVRLSGSPTRYVVTIERYTPHARLMASLKRFGLSSRECEVLLLALEGKTAAETAAQLNIAVSTAADHLSRLQQKTGARNKGDLIAKVLGWHSNTPTDLPGDTEGEHVAGIRDRVDAARHDARRSVGEIANIGSP